MKRKESTQKTHWGAWVLVKWKPGTPPNAWEKWRSCKEIKDAWSTSGDWDASLWLDIQDPTKVEDVVWRKIRSNKWVDRTETHWSKQWW